MAPEVVSGPTATTPFSIPRSLGLPAFREEFLRKFPKGKIENARADAVQNAIHVDAVVPQSEADALDDFLGTFLSRGITTN